MLRRLIYSICLAFTLSAVWAGAVDAAEVTPHVYVDFVGGVSGTAYTLGPREFDTTGTFGAHHGTEQVADGLGVLADADGAGQESFEFDASSFNNNGSTFAGTPFVLEAVFTPTGPSGAMAPVMDIGGQCFIRYHDGLSAGSWDGATEVSNNNIQDIPNFGQTHHYAIVYDGGEIIDYYLDGVAIFQSDNGSPQDITTLISWGNIRHSSVDGGRQLIGQYEAVSFSTFTGTFDPEADFILPEGPVSRALAFEPQPEDQGTDVLRDVVASWMPGEYAVAHDVYLGTVFEDVNDASRADPMGVLFSEGQSDTAIDLGRLAFGQTYYWRVDEVNAAPDNTVHKGLVWSFTTEPLAYPVESVVATSNAASEPGMELESIVNGSGLNEDDEHSVDSGDMWSGDAASVETMWIQFELDRIYKLHEMLVWNYNVQFELLLGFGIKNATIEYSQDGENWTSLGDVELAQGTATADYASNTTVDFGGAPVKFVRLTANDGYGTMGKRGLSEVRFTYIPVQARYPEPGDGATEVDVDTNLSWRGGREAEVHEVYLDLDRAAVADGTALLDTVAQVGYMPGTLQFGSVYYWKVTEVNEAEATASWDGDVWSFTTQAFGVVDDFEAYDDDQKRIYDTWVDGWVNETGSVVGYAVEPFAERGIVNGGLQSMPLEYNNGAAPFYSEASRTWAPAQDWTAGGADSLRLYVQGAADNEAAPMYVAVEDSAGNVAVVTHSDPDVALATEWQEWTIPLSALADACVNLAAVETMHIGLGDRSNPAAGGAGLIYVDDIGIGTPLP